MTALSDLPMLVTPKQAASLLGPSESQVRGLIRDGRLAHVMVGKRVMIPRDAIQQFIACNTRQSCQGETKALTSIGSKSGLAGTSSGPSEAAAASAALARQTAKQLRSRSLSLSNSEPHDLAPVIRLRS
jgi:excisionase family DNA binding protein